MLITLGSILVTATIGFGSLWIGWQLYSGHDYDTRTVTITRGDGSTLTLTPRVADTIPKRITGLSETTFDDIGDGMLFEHTFDRKKSYVMRGMGYDLDIVFISAREIEAIEYASAPDPDQWSLFQTKYSNQAKYVLELPSGATDEYSITVGDTVDIEDS